MAGKKQGEAPKRRVIDKAFKAEALRILKTSGRTLAQVADDLGVGNSTLSTWKRKADEAELLAGPHDDLHKELARLRRENDLLRAERDLLKKATAFFAKETSR
jgi:transposase